MGALMTGGHDVGVDVVASYAIICLTYASHGILVRRRSYILKWPDHLRAQPLL